MHRLTSEDRLQLLRFVCSFAWADLVVTPQERSFIELLALQQGVDEHERAQVRRWLKSPPRPEEVDPFDIPLEHKRLFLETAKALMQSDGVISPREEETFRIFKDLLR